MKHYEKPQDSRCREDCWTQRVLGALHIELSDSDLRRPYRRSGVTGGRRTVALTFDDGPGPSTAALLAILDSFEVPATFFDIGLREVSWPSTVEEEAASGFLIGAHTWSHQVMTSLSVAATSAEIDKAAEEQVKLTGVAPCVFRPPYDE